jgi:pyruvate dehydrogenase E2 component (dihydrolipoamide acetyltransferase)
LASEVTLPALGESVTEGTVTRWLKQVGDTVAVDEPLLEVSTDKVDTEIPSPVAGTLLEIKANEDDTVEVGAVLAVVGEEGESAGDASGSAEPEAQPADEEESEKKAEQEEQVAEETGELPPGDETPESEKDDAPAQSEPAAEEASSGESGGSGGGSGTPVTLPALGESVTEGTVTRWLKQVGDEVAVDEPLLEVSTDKVDTEIPSPVAGTLLEIKAEEDETVEVGAELAIIGSGDAAPAQAEEKPEPEPEAKAEPEPEPEPEPDPEPEPEPEPVPLEPAGGFVRSLAPAPGELPEVPRLEPLEPPTICSTSCARARCFCSVGKVALANCFTSASDAAVDCFRNRATSFWWSLTMCCMYARSKASPESFDRWSCAAL